MNEILSTLFVDNPCLPEQVCAFCSRLPEFRETRQIYHAQMDRIAERLGFQEADALEDAIIRYMGQQAHAYYLFGLGLRQEVLSALQ